MTSHQSYEIIEGRADAGLIFLCDHASNHLPAAYGSLGLPPEQLQRHIGYDIGARAATSALAAHFEAPAVMSCFSRLLIDPNRGEDDPTLIMKLSDGAVVPGNARIDAVEREQRLKTYYHPYHAAIDRQLKAMIESGIVPVIFSMHSFTHAWRGHVRPWHIACLWDLDDRALRPFMETLSADGDLVVGDNEPYDGALKNDCMYRHGTSLGIAHLLIELRQDLIGDDEGAEMWAKRMFPAVEAVNQRSECHELRQYGSRTGPVAYRAL